MDKRSLKYAAEACHGQFAEQAEVEFDRVCTDSREVRSGDLFVAVAGERFDGHQFVAQSAALGCSAAIVSKERWDAVRKQMQDAGCAGKIGVVLVDDTRVALGRLAVRYRQDFKIPMFAVAGSNGKTSTKDLTAAVLGQRFETLCSKASFNNDIGVPLTLLRLEKMHEVAVLEAGTNHPGELAPLLRMIEPQYGLMPSLGREHLEFFGSMRGVIEEEGSLAELLPPSGKLILNGDSEHADQVAARSSATVVRIGFEKANDWYIESVCVDDEGTSFKVRSPFEKLSGEYRIALLGRHQAANAVLAMVAGAELGMSREAMMKGLAECRPAKQRLQLWETNGIRILDDSYNANADSMLAALETLSQMRCTGRRVAVVGGMAELGTHALAAHREAGEKAARYGIDVVYALGPMAAEVVAAARGAGICKAECFSESADLADALKRELKAGDLVLLKASRAARLERIAESLRSLQ